MATIALLLRAAREADPLGVLCVCTMRREGFEPEEIAMLEELAGDIGFAVHALGQREQVERLERERRENYEQTILRSPTMIDQRDTYTAGHTVRVARQPPARRPPGAVREQTDLLQQAAILHDIGKIATPDSVLLKPGRLSRSTTNSSSSTPRQARRHARRHRHVPGPGHDHPPPPRAL